MTQDTDPPIIQADVAFSVEAVRSKSGRIDALSKRPRISPSNAEDTPDMRTVLVDPTRQITDTRAKIAQDDGDSKGLCPSSTEGASDPPTDPVDTASAQAQPAIDWPSEPSPEPVPRTEGETVAAPDVPSTLSESLPLSDLERRMVDIKNSNQSVARELEALEESLRQSMSST